jgi:hypothetical protein
VTQIAESDLVDSHTKSPSGGFFIAVGRRGGKTTQLQVGPWSGSASVMFQSISGPRRDLVVMPADLVCRAAVGGVRSGIAFTGNQILA